MRVSPLLRSLRCLAIVAFTTLAVIASASAAEPPKPASAAPLEDGLLLTLDLPPGDGDRFQHAKFIGWLADAARPVRAVIIHQHGCGNVTPAHAPITVDFHWRALARKHDAMLLVPQYQVTGACDQWNDPDSGSERALFAALAHFSKGFGRVEIADAPWILWGHSGGSSWSVQMILRHRERVLAASFRGGCHKQFGAPEFRAKFGPFARELPMLFVWGKRESAPPSKHHVSWEPMNAMYRELRGLGGRVARVIDPRSEHGCDDSRLMIIPFFDAVLAARAEGKPMPGELVDTVSLEWREMIDANLRDPTLAWLPNEALARRWKEFSQAGTIRPVDPPTTAPDLRATVESDGRVRLYWRVVPALGGGLRALRIHRDGKLWKELGVKAGDNLATGRDSSPEGLRESTLIDDTAASGVEHTYQLTFLDAAGNESPPSAPVRVGR